MLHQLSHKTIHGVGQYGHVTLDGIPVEVARSLLRQMLRLRLIEEALHGEYHPADEMRCPIHFCVGQEAIPAALSLCIEKRDYLFSHHRSHGYYFAKGSPLKELFAELYGRATGANGGRAGSQDISHTGTNFFSGAILAGAVAIGTGAAFGISLRGTNQISVCGLGEGATDEGTFWEAMNFAGNLKLPALFLIENNRYATASDQLKRQASDNICERVRPFGVRSTQIFGNDVSLAYRIIKEEVARLRSGGGPALVEAYTFRWSSHVGPEDDGANFYRTKSEMDFWKRNCPIALMENSMKSCGYIASGEKEEWEREISAEIVDLFRYAKSSSFPNTESWYRANVNVNEITKFSSELRTESETNSYDMYQADAKLAPY